ncbi:MAG: NTP transferase domain-containing protein [Solirubrobacterales bacterium]|nr:NTP transferase domain-containing protein [Solirubrobacterales bacterium]
MLPTVVILCGGRGTRLQEQGHSLPKPLVEIGGRPILWHVMQIYLAQGFRQFILLTGFKAELIERFVREEVWPAGSSIQCLETGLDTPTGGRLRRAATAIDGEPFCVTYADGVADIDLHALIEEHNHHRKTATMTVVRPELQFGIADLNGDGLVRGFIEKPRSEQWINGGFFFFEPNLLEIVGEADTLEREPLGRLAAAEELRAYCHEGFWECMDTYKDAVQLNDLWHSGRAPWKLWD